MLVTNIRRRAGKVHVYPAVSIFAGSVTKWIMWLWFLLTAEKCNYNKQ